MPFFEATLSPPRNPEDGTQSSGLTTRVRSLFGRFTGIQREDCTQADNEMIRQNVPQSTSFQTPKVKAFALDNIR